MKNSVIIIGGGIAGLGAARELTRNGCKVILLEASERFGGRIRTEIHGELPIELGAEFVHGRSKPLLGIIKAAGLSAREVNEDSHVFDHGKLKPLPLWENIERVISRINPRKPDSSFADFLRKQKLSKLDRQFATNFAEGFNAARADRISAHSILRGQYSADQMDGSWQGRVTQGYGELIRFLQKEVEARGGCLRTRARVTRVHWRKDHAQVLCRGARGPKTFTADAAIVTLPLGIWRARTVRFEPPLAEKQFAAAELQFGQVMKFSLLFRKRWWPKAGNGFVHAPFEGIPTWWGDSRGPLLTGWAGGTKAETLMGLSAPHREKLCLEILGRIFSEKPSSLKAQLVGVHHYDWSGDSNFRGAYSYIPVNGLDLPKVLAAPVADTLFFAGEATALDAQMGTVFGAYESGLRAAKEILDSRK